jgi:hypothetical protein
MLKSWIEFYIQSSEPNDHLEMSMHRKVHCYRYHVKVVMCFLL